MAQRYYSIEKVAEVLGVSPAEVNRLRERNELHAYRDGADWKFKAEEVEEYLARQIKSRGKPESEDDSVDVLLGELPGGPSGPGSSGTVIGPTLGAAPDSDIQATESELRLASSGLHLSEETVPPPEGTAPSSEISKADDLELTLDADLTLEDSQIALVSTPATAGFGTSDSSLELADAGSMDDDDLVLGGGSSGSDITIGGDSGISLVDPTDSGLSLEEPLQVAPANESVELGEDDMLTISQGSSVIGAGSSGDAASESPTQLKADSDFLLTPMEEVSGEDTESSSQVIALDAESEIDDSSATMATSMSEIGAGGAGANRPGMAAVVQDDSIGGPGIDLDTATAGAAAPVAATLPPRSVYGEAPAAMTQAMGQGMMVLLETPYPTWVMILLISGTVVLGLGGMMSFDLLRNMWSWSSPYSFNSSIMDAILSIF